MQVQNMLLIYRKASNVIAWIGEKKNGGFDVIDLVKRGPIQTKHSTEMSVRTTADACRYPRILRQSVVSEDVGSSESVCRPKA